MLPDRLRAKQAVTFRKSLIFNRSQSEVFSCVQNAWRFGGSAVRPGVRIVVQIVVQNVVQLGAVVQRSDGESVEILNDSQSSLRRL
jgi:hypothetical protein